MHVFPENKRNKTMASARFELARSISKPALNQSAVRIIHSKTFYFLMFRYIVKQISL